MAIYKLCVSAQGFLHVQADSQEQAEINAKIAIEKAGLKVHKTPLTNCQALVSNVKRIEEHVLKPDNITMPTGTILN